MERKMFDSPVLPRLETILADVHLAELLVPEFQRPFVWNDDQRLSLLDSILRGMPIGSLLVWRSQKNRDLHTYKKVGGVAVSEISNRAERLNYLIDGHQRISTLFGALYAGERDAEHEDESWQVFYDLSARERPAFRLPPRRGTVPIDWLPLNILLDGDRLFDFTQQLRERGLRPLAKDAENLANIFRDYIIPVVPLVTEELDVVTDAFVRINSQGKSMSEAHMLRALTHLAANDTDRHFAKVRARLEPLGWGTLDDQVLVNVLKVELGLGVYSSSVRGLLEALQVNPTPLSQLADVLEAAVKLVGEVGVKGPDALPYAYQVVTLAALAALTDGTLSEPRLRDRLKQWFWTTTYTEHFSGITGRRIRDEIDALAGNLASDDAIDAVHAPIEPLVDLRMGTVRARAFLLFLAQLPKAEDARQRRQERLAAGDANSTPIVIPSAPGSKPGNRVIADLAEVHEIRTAIKNRSITSAMADEYGIPEEASALLPDYQAFVEARGRWLVAQEAVFMRNFGLEVDTEADTLTA